MLLPRVTDTTDYFGEFIEEHPGLWPERDNRREVVDPFSEFGTETHPADDRSLRVAGGGPRRAPGVGNYRHTLAVASVLISLFMPAGIISTIIIGRQLLVSPTELGHALPALPSRVVASVDRLMGVAAIDLPSLPRRPADPLGDTPSGARVDSVAAVSVNSSPAPARPAPAVMLPLTTALLSAQMAASEPAGGPPPPAPAVLPPTSNASPATSSTDGTGPNGNSAAPLPPPKPPATAPVESAAVRAALDRYREAFSHLDAASAKSVWPAVDEKMLSRAFSQLSRQSFVFDACHVDVNGARATASCQGRAEYVPKVGNRAARFEPRQWTFTLRRAEAQWTIESVDSR